VGKKRWFGETAALCLGKPAQQKYLHVGEERTSEMILVTSIAETPLQA